MARPRSSRGVVHTVKAEAPPLVEHVTWAKRTTGYAWPEFLQTYQQAFRVRDDSLERYELFVGLNGPPDPDAPGQPVATSPTLPFSWSPSALLPSSGTGTLWCFVRYRNAYGLESFNVYPTLLQYVAHSQVLGPITPPFDVAVYDDVVGYVKVIAKYLSTEDPNLPADTWEVYAKVGSDPVPGVDLPAFAGPMVFVGVESGVSQVVGPYSPAGGILHVVVAAKRVSDSRRGVTATVLHTLPGSLDLQEGELFGGRAFEQQWPE